MKELNLQELHQIDGGAKKVNNGGYNGGSSINVGSITGNKGVVVMNNSVLIANSSVFVGRW